MVLTSPTVWVYDIGTEGKRKGNQLYWPSFPTPLILKKLLMPHGAKGNHMTSEEARKNFEKFWADAYGNRPEKIISLTPLQQRKQDKPEEGKIYSLTGGQDTPAISNGNTWQESEVKPKSATIAERNRAIKKELVKVYGKNVTVTGNRGTAYGWIDIRIELPTPPEHTHDMNQYGRCQNCWKLEKEEEQNVRSICHRVAKEVGSYIGSYSADDGYNTSHDEILIRIEYK